MKLFKNLQDWYEWHFGFTDWRKLRRQWLMVILLPVGVVLCLYGIRFAQALYFSGRAPAFALTYEPIKGISQSRRGSYTSVFGYRIGYSYRVNGRSYRQVTTRSGWRVSPAKRSGVVWYNPKNPEESILFVE
jgi:hypothetical protein